MLARQLPRLLESTLGAPRTLGEHEAAFASTTRVGSLLEELDASGLTGRGGAAFSTARKARLLREQRGHHKVVVVNAMESEPASHKDATLLSTNPHLVLDGAEVLASIIGAHDVAVCVARGNLVTIDHVKRALAERQHRGRRGPTLTLQTPPGRYVAGEESALVQWLNEHESLPQYRAHRPYVLKLAHRPVLVDNAETCAHVGLIARFGAQWFRSLGTSTSPGSTLVSLTGAVARPIVLEVELGATLRTILAAGGAEGDPRALLLGGYGGTWMSGNDLDVAYDHETLLAHGASIGAGVIVVLGRESCGLMETQRIVRWMANESARQCGPCAFGLPALRDDLDVLSRSSPRADEALLRLAQRSDEIDGRGACHHPDGVVRLVRSAMRVFGDDAAMHARGERCDESSQSRRFVAVPQLEHESDLQWE